MAWLSPELGPSSARTPWQWGSTSSDPDCPVSLVSGPAMCGDDRVSLGTSNHPNKPSWETAEDLRTQGDLRVTLPQICFP